MNVSFVVRRALPLSLSLMGVLSVLAAPPQEGVSAPVSASPRSGELPLRHTIAPGVVLRQEIVPETGVEGPLAVTLIEVDLKKKGVRVSAALGQDHVWGNDATFGREIVSKLAARHKAVAAVNAGFFPFTGSPIGLHIQDGEMVTEPAANRTSLLLKEDHTAVLEAFTCSAQVRAGKGEDAQACPLNGMNRRPGKKDDLLLYTPIFQDRTLKALGRTEVVLTGIDGPILPNKTYRGTVSAVSAGGETPLSPGSVILSGSGNGADFLKENAPVGARLSFRLEVKTVDGNTFDFSDVRDAVTGGPRIVGDGKVSIADAAEGFSPDFSRTRHPRTAVGLTQDNKLLLVVVDGRQKGVSRGMSLTELANLFLKYGIRNAVNLDGGGSSTAIVRDLIVNSPSEGKERAVADALLVFSPLSEKRGKRDNPETSLPNPPASLLPGDRFSFGESLPTGKGVWGVTGGIGFVSQTGVFTAVRPGSGAVLYLPDGSRVPLRIPVTVSAPAHPAPPTPKAEPGEPDE